MASSTARNQNESSAALLFSGVLPSESKDSTSVSPSETLSLPPRPPSGRHADDVGTSRSGGALSSTATAETAVLIELKDVEKMMEAAKQQFCVFFDNQTKLLVERLGQPKSKLRDDTSASAWPIEKPVVAVAEKIDNAAQRETGAMAMTPAVTDDFFLRVEHPHEMPQSSDNASVTLHRKDDSQSGSVLLQVDTPKAELAKNPTSHSLSHVAKHLKAISDDPDADFSGFIHRALSSHLTQPAVREEICFKGSQKKKDFTHQLTGTMFRFYKDFKKADILEDNVAVVNYVLERLKFYIQSLQQEVWLGASGDRISGVWQVFEILKQISFEFESGNEFGIELMRNFDYDIREAIQDNWMELVIGKQEMNYAPWTKQGQQFETDLIDYLIQADDEVAGLVHGPKGPHKSISQALSTIKGFEKNDQGMYVSGKLEWTEAEFEKFKNDVKKRLLDPASKQAWWRQGPVPRAFFIGLKDLWQSDGWRQLQYILRQAKKVKNRGQASDRDKIPFYWVQTIMNLAGPNVVNFLGDSDAFAGLSERLERVRYFTLPRFSYEAVDFASELQTRLRHINHTKLKVLSLMTAFLIAFFNALMKRWADATST